LTTKEENLNFCFPPIKLDHIKTLTAFGIQFSKFSEPDPESGYTLDDNARALINMVMYHKFKPNEETLSLATYLRYIEGIQRPNGWFDNYKDYDNELTAKL
jgi:hypothetical protein